MPVTQLKELKHYREGTVYSELNRVALEIAKNGPAKGGLVAKDLMVGFRPGSQVCYMPASL
jgi:hypothetical protein